MNFSTEIDDIAFFERNFSDFTVGTVSVCTVWSIQTVNYDRTTVSVCKVEVAVLCVVDFAHNAHEVSIVGSCSAVFECIADFESFCCTVTNEEFCTLCWSFYKNSIYKFWCYRFILNILLNFSTQADQVAFLERNFSDFTVGAVSVCAIWSVQTVNDDGVAIFVQQVEVAVTCVVDFTYCTIEVVVVWCCSTIFECIANFESVSCYQPVDLCAFNCNLESLCCGFGTTCDCSNKLNLCCGRWSSCDCEFAISKCSKVVCLTFCKSPCDCCIKSAFCWECKFVAFLSGVNDYKVILSHSNLFSICVCDFTDVGNGVSGVWVNLECLGVNGNYTSKVYHCTNFEFFVQLKHCSFVDEVDCVVNVEFYITTRKCEVVVNFVVRTVSIELDVYACDCSILQCNTAVLVSCKSCIFVSFSSSKSSSSINVRELFSSCCVTSFNYFATFVEFVLSVVSCNCTRNVNFCTDRPLSAKFSICCATFCSINWSVSVVTMAISILQVQATLRAGAHANNADNVCLDTNGFARTSTIVSLASCKVLSISVNYESFERTVEADGNRFAVDFVSFAFFVCESSCQCVSNVFARFRIEFDCNLLGSFVECANLNCVFVASSNVYSPLNVCSFATRSNHTSNFVCVCWVAIFVHVVDDFLHAIENICFQRWSTCCKQHGNTQHNGQKTDEK